MGRHGDDLARVGKEHHSLLESELVDLRRFTTLSLSELFVLSKKGEESMNKESEILYIAGDNSGGNFSQSLLIVHGLQVRKSVGDRVLITLIVGRLLSSFVDFNFLNLRNTLLESPHVLSILD